MKRYRLNNKMLIVLMTGCLTFNACISDRVADFEKDGVNITTYLENNEWHDYSEFLKWMAAVGVDGMLNARGNYSCFIPTNEAVMKFYADKETTFEQMTQEEIETFVYTHIIRLESPTSDPIESKYFPNGTIGYPNMEGRFLQITFNEAGDMYVNQKAKILLPDQGRNSPYFIRNGVVHTIDNVIEPVRSNIAGLIENHTDRFSLFISALQFTGLIDSLEVSANEDYNEKRKSGKIPPRIKSMSSFCNETGYQTAGAGGTLNTPIACAIGFTLLMESDETYREAGIHTIEDMQRYAEENMVPKKPAAYNDPTDRDNSLNRFIAYHIIDRTMDINDFIPAVWENYYLTGTTYMDYTQTLSPYGLIEIQRDLQGPIVNKRKDGSAVRILRIPENNTAENGILHEIDRLLTYDSGVESDVLNKRIRMDVTSILPEMQTNRLIGNSTYENKNGLIFPAGYFKSMIQLSEGTQIQYGGAMPSGWNDLHMDEFLIVGKYDVKLRLPPLPPGSYEIRIGYTANANRGVLQIYLDGQPLGIPLDMTKDASSPDIGYERPNPENDRDPNGFENDKMMRNRGYMKGPGSLLASLTVANKEDQTLRYLSRALRRVLTTARLDEGEHWLRFKSVEDISTREFMFDYLEFVPTSYLDKEGID